VANLVFAAPQREVPHYGCEHSAYGGFALPGMTAATAEVNDSPHGATLGRRVPLVTDVAEPSPVFPFTKLEGAPQARNDVIAFGGRK
jgi:hypothetical protein